jgi:hypothetical protein
LGVRPIATKLLLRAVALEHHDLGFFPFLDSSNLRAQGQPDALALELRGKHGRGIGVLTGQQLGLAADDRHLAAEPPERLR